MKIEELPNCPQWLKDASTENANVEWCACRCGAVQWRGGVWHNGDWHDGVWHDGVWRDGDWHGGVWHDGDWRDGVWHGGVWHDGVWRNGDWHDGVWHDGVWHDGVWRDGDWRGGVWRGGVWRGGDWRGGVWRGGRSTCRSKYTPVLNSTQFIQIGCKTFSREKWDEWFAGSEVFDTPRDTEAFRLIEAHYRALVVWAEYAGLLPRKEVEK